MLSTNNNFDPSHKSKIKLIAEVGSVHDGSFGNAIKLVELYSQLGADVIKFQTHIAEYETTEQAPSPSFFNHEPRYSYFARTSFSRNQLITLKKACDDNGVVFASSAFSVEACDLLMEIGSAYIKIPSGELTNHELLNKCALKNFPVHLSTGMSDFREIDEAVEILQASDLTLYQCSSMYPCSSEKVGINVLDEFRDRYPGLKYGFSDHTSGYAASAFAATKGVAAIEKHVGFSKFMYGSDAQFSLVPEEFTIFVNIIREIESIASNPVDKNDLALYSEMKLVFEKSYVSAKSLKSGTQILKEHLLLKKPGSGFKSNQLNELVNRRLKYSVDKDHIFMPRDFE